MAKSESVPAKKRAQLRDEFFPETERLWLGPEEKGYFCAPRSLPLLLDLLKSKEISGKQNPSSVYIELLSRHMGEGIIEMVHEEDHASASGYTGTRATRSWRDRMRILEDIGLIKTVKKGNRPYAYVALIHPTIVVERLHEEGKVPEDWWNDYRSRQIETKEPTSEKLKNSSEAS